jgi:hypothetical protein
LAGQGEITGQSTVNQLEEGIVAQGIRVVLILATAGDLEDPLADQ